MINNPLAKLSVQHLKRAVAIREQLESLQNELDRMIGGLTERKETLIAKVKNTGGHLGSRPPQQRPPGKTSLAASANQPAAKNRRKPAPPGQLKERIIRVLKEAGKQGVTIKDLAAKLGRSYDNINVWFHSTAKKVKEIKKVGPARFAWVG
jgi:hypothetical protein